MQKHTHLKLRPNTLISDGLFSLARNINYFGEWVRWLGVGWGPGVQQVCGRCWCSCSTTALSRCLAAFSSLHDRGRSCCSHPRRHPLTDRHPPHTHTHRLLIYGAFVAVDCAALRSLWPAAYLAAYVALLWLPGMRRKDTSLARHPGFAAYKQRTKLFIPYVV